MDFLIPPQVAQRAHRTACGLWLFAVAIATIIFVVFSLSAFQLQTRIQNFSVGGEPFSIWTVERIIKSREAIREELQPLLRQHAEFVSQRTKAYTAYSLANAESASIWGEIRDAIDRLESLVQQKEPEFKLPEVQFNQLARFTLLSAKVAKHELKDAAEPMMKAFDSAWARQRANDAERGKAADIQKSLSEEIPKLESLIKTIRDKEESEISGPAKNKILDFASELEILRTQYSYIRELARIPNELLTTLLVLCMGTLGSTIYLTQLFFGPPPRPSFSLLVFRQLLGALVALALFIVVKAGVIAAADPRSLSQSGADLNPFLLAFLAIVGGLLSEQTVDKIKQYGQSWFAASGTRPRYARGISAELRAQSKSVEELAKLLGAQPQAVELWLTETEPVPPRAQSIIAAWLNRSERDLFSDMPG